MSKTREVEGGYSIGEYRRLLDEDSGIAGLPGMKVVRRTPEFKNSLARIKRKYPNVTVILAPRATFDGTIELIPTIVILPFNRFNRVIKNE